VNEEAPSVGNAVRVWHDLELALAGKNGYGGDVAEVYAYLLIAPRLKDQTDPVLSTCASEAEERAAKEAAARNAGANLTDLLRSFADLHDGVFFSIEEREGFRTIDLDTEVFPPFDWRVHLRVTRVAADPPPAPSVHEVRQALDATTGCLGVLSAMLDELAVHRARARLGAGAPSPSLAVTGSDDLPPDGPTGLYLDRPIDADELEWFKKAWDALLSRGAGGTPERPLHLMLVFEAIRRDARATTEFLRVMNADVLPLLRRLRLRDQPQFAKLGAVDE